MSRYVRSSLVLLVALLSAACTVTATSEEQEVPAVGAASADAIELQSSQHCGLTAPGVVLVRSQAQWRELGRTLRTSLPAEQLPDFDNHWLVIAALGQKPTGGFSVELASARQSGDQLELRLRQSAPGPDDMVTQALTTPCSIIRVPAHGWSELLVSGEAPFPVSRKR